jgi:hypothetical protein
MRISPPRFYHELMPEAENLAREAISHLRAFHFPAAAECAAASLHLAAKESFESLLETSRILIREKGIFPNKETQAKSEAFFRTIHETLRGLCGDAAPATHAAADNLSGILGALGKHEEAIALRESVLRYLNRTYAPDDQRVMHSRDALAFLYRRVHRGSDADALYRDAGICEHLTPVLHHLIAEGRKIVSCGRPWSDNCHVWIYFESVLECEGLVAKFGATDAVQIHDHRGTHDGAERGLVCRVHHDGLMGMHPS